MYISSLEHPWLTPAEKRRLLEYKIRLDLVQYVERGRPPINIDAIYSYEPKVASNSSVRGKRARATIECFVSRLQVSNIRPAEIGRRLMEFGDDGHGIKQARATAICYELMKDWENASWAILRGDDVWKKIQHMVVGSLEVNGPLYVRSAGFDEAWTVSDPMGGRRVVAEH